MSLSISFVQTNLFEMKTLNNLQKISLLVAILFCIIVPTIGYIKIGPPSVIIVGGAAITGFLFWYFTYLRNPTDPKIILPFL